MASIRNYKSPVLIHAGGGSCILTRDIIGIFDLDSSTTSATTRELLRRMEEDGRVETLPGSFPRSAVLCAFPLARGLSRDEGRITISPVTSGKLAQRAGK